LAFQYQKAKSAAKLIEVKGAALDKVVLKTMGTIADIVGATLGPGGMPVLIERAEFNLPALITKDGVSVMRSLGFQSPVQHSILEAARDAAVRTASEAGDGTTTATVLAYSIVANLHKYCKANPRVSPQRVVRLLEETFRKRIEPLIKGLSLEARLEDEVGRALLQSVARVSANGDQALAEAVMQCFDMVGDNGNVTITEGSGASHYEVEKISGFPIPLGLEECCLRFAPDFINDPGSQRCIMGKPAFLIYHGKVDSIQSLYPIMEKVAAAGLDPGEREYKHVNLVIVATSFSDSAITGLATNFKDGLTMNAYPLVAPVNSEPGSQLQFLHDVAAITGAVILEQNSIPLDQAQLLHLGRGVEAFEAHRWRSNIIIGEPKDNDDEATIQRRIEREDRILNRSAEVEEQLKSAPSQWTTAIIQERLAKLTGGIARLKVIGASNGELKEKRDRAEDAVCGVRGAIKHGCLPGGCWTLLKVIDELRKLKDPILDATLIPALKAPFERLLHNSGIVDPQEAEDIIGPILRSMVAVKDDEGNLAFKPCVYDCLEGKHVDAIEGGILDSTPAVLEAIRNALSIASLLGTLGGTVVFLRDAELERSEARANADFLREDDSGNEADERG
jgi:chaperonin GroEL